MSSTLSFGSARVAFIVTLALVGCATSATVGDADPSPEPVTDPGHASLPAPQASSASHDGQDGNDAAATDGHDAGTTSGMDASKKPDSAPPPPPPPPAICINEAGAPWSAQTPCGCDKDCVTGLTCAQVGGLVDPWCCAPSGIACSDANDCCGQLLCVAGKCK